MLDKLDQPAVINRPEEITDVCVRHPVHGLPHDADPQRVQRIVRTAPGPKSVGEPQEVLVVNRVEDRHDGLLNDFVLQGGDAQGALTSIGFRDVGSPGRLRAIRPLMHPTVETGQLGVKARLVLTPRRAIDARRSFSLERVETLLKPSDRHVVEQRRELCPLVLSCDFPHAEQTARLAGPALRPERGRLLDVLLGRPPSLHALRRQLPAIVRTLRWYFAAVRLPTNVHGGLRAHALLHPTRRAICDACRWGLPVLARGVSMHAWGLRLRRVRDRLAIAPAAVWPSVTWYDVGTPDAIISQLNALPTCAPVNASVVALRLATHDSGSGWVATPFLCDAFIHDSTPVYPGAHHGLLNCAECGSGMRSSPWPASRRCN